MPEEADYQIPVIDDSFKSKAKAVIFLYKYGVPNIIFTISYYLSDLVSYHYAGYNYSTEFVAAYGIVLSWVSAFGMLIVYSVSQGMSVFTGHAYGKGDFVALRKLFGYGLWFILLICAILSVFYVVSPWIMVLVGIDSDLADISRPLLLTSILFIFPCALNTYLMYFASA
mmetsp:Transcript_10357/g.8912  ORF Transcript_10357/g.8912 Transcript_10357/m.8912 type:complete len:170 (-) Transcript_10357:1127-1636(-)